MELTVKVPRDEAPAPTAGGAMGVFGLVLDANFGTRGLQDNRVFANRSNTYLSGLNFFNSAENFRRVTINLNSSGFNVGIFQDSSADDEFVGSAANATLFSADNYWIFTENLDRVTAISSNGGKDTLSVQNIDFQFSSFGNWS